MAIILPVRALLLVAVLCLSQLCTASVQSQASRVERSGSTSNSQPVDRRSELKARAYAAEKSDPGNGSRVWLNLINDELAQGHLNEALDYAQSAVTTSGTTELRFVDETKSGRETVTDAMRQFLYLAPVLPGEGSIVQALVKNGRSVEAEKLLLLANDKAKALFNADSSYLAYQRAQLMVFYLNQNKEQKAQACLDALLSVNLVRLDNYASPNGHFVANVCSNAMMMARRGDEDSSKNAMMILNSLLKHVQKQFNTDDSRIANVQNLISAIKNKKLETYPTLASPFTRANSSTNGIVVEKDGRDSELDREISVALTKKDDQTLQSLLKLRIKRLEDRPNQSDVSRASFMKNQNLLSDYRALIDALTRLGRRDEAKEKAVRISNSLPIEQLGFRDLLTLAEIQVAAGNTSEGKRLALMAESRPTSNWSAGGVQSLMANFWHLSGDKSREEIARSKAAGQLLFQRQLSMQKVVEEKFQGKLAAPSASTAESTRIDQSSDKFVAAPTSTDKYSFLYAAFATDILEITDVARVIPAPDMTPFPVVSFAATPGRLITTQPVCRSGNLKWMYGASNGLVIRPYEPVDTATQFSGSRGPGGSTGVGGPVMSFGPGGASGGFSMHARQFGAQSIHNAPSVPAMPLASCPKPSADCKTLATGADLTALLPGDYRGNKIETKMVVLPKAGRVRIFLDQSNSGVVFSTLDFGFVNTSYGKAPFESLNPSRLELWYDGTGTIKLSRGTRFNGIIYAPHAKVYFGPDDVEFTGSVIAKEIHAIGSVSLMYNSRLMRWKEEVGVNGN